MCASILKLRLFGKNIQSFPVLHQSSNYHQASTELAKKVKFAKLEHRQVISLKGADTTSFLQGIITNDVTLLPEMKCMYAMILNQHGRVLHDVILYHPKNGNVDEVLLECEKVSSQSIMKMLKLYKLRKKLTMTLKEDMVVLHAFSSAIQKDNGCLGDVIACNSDPRVPQFGHRILVENFSRSIINGVDWDINGYHRKRYETGIPEGTSDLPSGNCLPLECNLDFMNGVSFHKGCYIGQELTARTKFTGVIRKRLIPITTYGDGQIEPGETVYVQKGKRAGKILSLHASSNVGLALVRLGYTEETLAVKSGEVKLKSHIPDWWPSKDGTEFSDGVCGPYRAEENA